MVHEYPRPDSGESKLNALVGSSSAFSYVNSDVGVGKKRKLFHARYTPSSGKLPLGFGVWPENAKTQPEPGTLPVGEWIEEPEPGQEVIFKLQPLRAGFDYGERAALQKTNRLFTPSDSSRPVRLYGFGTGHRLQGEYLILEYIPPQFFQLGNYLSDERVLSIHEVVEMALSLAEVLRRSHQDGVSHGDLDSAGLKQHVFWDPSEKKLRIIDWQNADFLDPSQRSQGGIPIDHSGIGQLISKGLVGESMFTSDAIFSETLQRRFGTDVGISISRVAEMSIGVNPRGEDIGYPSTPQGTEELYQDLVALRGQVNR